MSALKSIYTLGELAEMAGISRWVMMRELRAFSVRVHQRGRVRVVYLSALRNGAPDLWEAMIYRAQLIKNR